MPRRKFSILPESWAPDDGKPSLWNFSVYYAAKILLIGMAALLAWIWWTQLRPYGSSECDRATVYDSEYYDACGFRP
jgi:hypothetical protein